jgi:hypothetical protein
MIQLFETDIVFVFIIGCKQRGWTSNKIINLFRSFRTIVRLANKNLKVMCKIAYYIYIYIYIYIYTSSSRSTLLLLFGIFTRKPNKGSKGQTCNLCTVHKYIVMLDRDLNKYLSVMIRCQSTASRFIRTVELCSSHCRYSIIYDPTNNEETTVHFKYTVKILSIGINYS